MMRWAKRTATSAAAAATNVSMELDVLDCSICSEPVSPPVFQCSVGHLICPSCHGKRKKCHHCSGKSIVYERSYAIEKVLGPIQVPCSNAEYGCAVKTSYYSKADHEQTCPHAPCFCPEISCGFTGSTGMLLAHLTTEHRWPSTKFSYGRSFSVDVPPVQEAAAHVVVVLSGEDDDDGRLFLLDVAPAAPVGCVVAVFCIRPREDETKFRCEVSLTYSETENNSSHIYTVFGVPSAKHDARGWDSAGLLRVGSCARFCVEKDGKICVTMNKALALQTPCAHIATWIKPKAIHLSFIIRLVKRTVY